MNIFDSDWDIYYSSYINVNKRLQNFFICFTAWHLLTSVINLILTFFKGNKGCLKRLRLFLNIQPIVLLLWLAAFIYYRLSYEVTVCLCDYEKDYIKWSEEYFETPDLEKGLSYMKSCIMKPSINSVVGIINLILFWEITLTLIFILVLLVHYLRNVLVINRKIEYSW